MRRDCRRWLPLLKRLHYRAAGITSFFFIFLYLVKMSSVLDDETNSYKTLARFLGKLDRKRAVIIDYHHYRIHLRSDQSFTQYNDGKS